MKRGHAVTLCKKEGELGGTIRFADHVYVKRDTPTGGIGTTIFYIIGAILICVAVVALVTRCRVNAKAA